MKTRKNNPKMIARLTKEEFEMDDGSIYPIPFPIEELPILE